MKKFLGLTLSALMVFGLAGCGEKAPELANSYDYFYSTDMSTMDYVVTDKANNHQHNVNFVEGLLQNDANGNYIPAAAESVEPNEDATVWTFKIREGVKWVNAAGEYYDDMTAHDFVTGLQHAADFDSETLPLVKDLIVGLADYVEGKVGFDQVGVKALDDYTLEYTLTGSTPYFSTMTTYTILYPINKEFLESKGTGCKLGEPDKNACDFGLVQQDSILYSGPFILSEVQPESVISYTKNANYWDADNVFIDTAKFVYFDGTDKKGIIDAFEAGTSVAAPIRGDWADYDEYAEKYANNMIAPRSNAYSFGVNFNFNRVEYNYTNKTTDAEKQNTHNAILNANFRKAFLAALDRLSYLSVYMKPEVAKTNLRNMNSVPNLVSTSNGTTYEVLLEEAYKAYTGVELDLADGQDPFYNPDGVAALLDAAATEAGITYPVSLDLITADLPTDYAMANSIKTSLEKNTDGKILINIISLPENDALNIGFYNNDPAKSDYDITTMSGWGPDYSDPKTFSDIYSIANQGAYLTKIGLYDAGVDATSDANATKAGFFEYQKLLDAADAIKGDLDARYAAYAKADAYFLGEALYIPIQQQGANLTVTKVVPYTAPYALGGSCGYKLNFMKVQKDLVTVEQYEAAKEANSK